MAIWGLGDITGAAYRYVAATDTESVYLTAGQSILKFSSAVTCFGTPGFSFGEAWPFHAGPGILTGLDYVEADGTMWACTSAGEVKQLTASGTVATSFQATIYLCRDQQAASDPRTADLEMAGYKVQVFETGGDLMRALSQAYPEVVLMDVLLDGKNGFEVCESLDLKRNGRLKVVLFGGVYSRPAFRDLANGLGVAAFVEAPLDDAELLALVRRVAHDDEQRAGAA